MSDEATLTVCSRKIQVRHLIGLDVAKSYKSGTPSACVREDPLSQWSNLFQTKLASVVKESQLSSVAVPLGVYGEESAGEYLFEPCPGDTALDSTL